MDDELQVAAGCHEGIAKPDSFLFKAGILASYINFITRQEKR